MTRSQGELPVLAVVGWAACPFHQKALAAATLMVRDGRFVAVDERTFATKEEFEAWLSSDRPNVSNDLREQKHTSSPFVFAGDSFIGGCDDTVALLASSPWARLRGKITEALQGSDKDCVRIMVSGSGAGCGKTTVCLAILGAALRAGLEPDQVAYIKPVTQCEDNMMAAWNDRPELLSAWTTRHNIKNVSGKSAPVVLFSGFAKSYLNKQQASTEQTCDQIKAEVNKLCKGRRLLLIDGIGHPAEGSICGVDNVDVALSAAASVVLVGEAHLSRAVDSFNMNAAYFTQRGVKVLGAVLNFAEASGFNGCSEIAKYFDLFLANSERSERLYGIVPRCEQMTGLRERVAEPGGCQVDDTGLQNLERLNIDHLMSAIDIACLITDAIEHKTVQTDQLAPSGGICPITVKQRGKRSRVAIEEEVKPTKASGG